jgi:hypothetical protein
MEWWSGGVVEWWSGGVVEWWSAGVLECWSAAPSLLFSFLCNNENDIPEIQVKVPIEKMSFL